jgi:hypothetical protein
MRKTRNDKWQNGGRMVAEWWQNGGRMGRKFSKKRNNPQINAKNIFYPQ